VKVRGWKDAVNGRREDRKVVRRRLGVDSTRGGVSGHAAVVEEVLMFGLGLMEAWQACSDKKETTYVNSVL
jgi:hypothetical protein